MFRRARSWWSQRQERKDVEWAEKHEWVDPAEVDDVTRSFEGEPSGPGMGVRGIAPVSPRHIGATKIKRGD